MAVLTKNEILKAIKKGRIKIEPFDEKNVGPGSVDLALANDFRIFKTRKKVYEIRNDSDFHEITDSVHIVDGQSIVIKPGEMILGITKEKITLADNICGRLEGRSRFARFGLAVHVTAGFMQPGISNHQVLEIVNLGHSPLALFPGTVVCQFVFEEARGHAKYQGRFTAQSKP